MADETNNDTGGLMTQATSGAESPSGVFDGYILPDGRFADGHADKLIGEYEPYRGTVSGYQTFGDMIKDLHILKAKGDSGVKIPGEGATAAEVAAWRKAIGAGEKPEDYALPKEHASLAKFAAEQGLTKAQAAKLVEMRTAESAAQKTASEKAAADALSSELKVLTDAWGGKTAVYAQQAADVAKLFNINLDDYQSASLVMAFQRLHESFSQSESLRSRLGTPGLVQDSTNPASVIQAVLEGKHPNSAKWRAGDPATVEWMRGLYRAKHSKA